jgi:hypothetical protein
MMPKNGGNEVVIAPMRSIRRETVGRGFFGCTKRADVPLRGVSSVRASGIFSPKILSPSLLLRRPADQARMERFSCGFRFGRRSIFT